MNDTPTLPMPDPKDYLCCVRCGLLVNVGGGEAIPLQHKAILPGGSQIECVWMVDSSMGKPDWEPVEVDSDIWKQYLSDRKAQQGECPVCGQTERLNGKGTLRQHYRPAVPPKRRHSICEGSGKEPKKTPKAPEFGTIYLEAIRTDGGTQSRVAMNAETIADYAEALKAGKTLPPVVVFYDNQDYWLADGFHRLAAHHAAELEEIHAEIHTGTQREAILYSVGANANHGLRRTNQDKRNAVLLLLRDPEWAAWSDRQIADVCGVTHPFVGKIRTELMNPEPAPEVVTVTTSQDGPETIEEWRTWAETCSELAQVHEAFLRPGVPKEALWGLSRLRTALEALARCDSIHALVEACGEIFPANWPDPDVPEGIQRAVLQRLATLATQAPLLGQFLTCEEIDARVNSLAFAEQLLATTGYNDEARLLLLEIAYIAWKMRLDGQESWPISRWVNEEGCPRGLKQAGLLALERLQEVEKKRYEERSAGREKSVAELAQEIRQAPNAPARILACVRPDVLGQLLYETQALTPPNADEQMERVRARLSELGVAVETCPSPQCARLYTGPTCTRCGWGRSEAYRHWEAKVEHARELLRLEAQRIGDTSIYPARLLEWVRRQKGAEGAHQAWATRTDFFGHFWEVYWCDAGATMHHLRRFDLTEPKTLAELMTKLEAIEEAEEENEANG